MADVPPKVAFNIHSNSWAFQNPAIFGVVFHVAARYYFSRASDLNTARLRMYSEYKRFKVASEAFGRDAAKRSVRAAARLHTCIVVVVSVCSMPDVVY